jgi:hypothetical protein
MFSPYLYHLKMVTGAVTVTTQILRDAEIVTVTVQYAWSGPIRFDATKKGT